jgi:AhpD family alkylhydroperoxidase
METRFSLFDSPTASKLLKRFYATSQVLEKSSLPKSLQDLVSLRVSQINGCGWCVDIHTKEAAAAGETALRLNMVATWRHSTVFTEAERAALALAEEGTRITVPGEVVSDATWDAARKQFDDDQLGTLICLIAMMNATNRISLIPNMLGGEYQPGMFATLEE